MLFIIIQDFFNGLRYNVGKVIDKNKIRNVFNNQEFTIDKTNLLNISEYVFYYSMGITGDVSYLSNIKYNHNQKGGSRKRKKRYLDNKLKKYLSKNWLYKYKDKKHFVVKDKNNVLGIYLLKKNKALIGFENKFFNIKKIMPNINIIDVC